MCSFFLCFLFGGAAAARAESAAEAGAGPAGWIRALRGPGGPGPRRGAMAGDVSLLHRGTHPAPGRLTAQRGSQPSLLPSISFSMRTT